MNSSMSELNELIEITRDGQKFYLHACEEVDDVELQHVFRDMAQAKTQIIQALSVKLASGHEKVSQGGTMVGRLRELYVDTKTKLGGDSRVAYVDQLEEVEDRILQAFEDALEGAEPDVRALLATELPRLRASHSKMQQLKHSLH